MDIPMFHSNLVSSRRILYTPSIFARINLLHMQEIGELQAQEPHTSQRSNLQSHLFLIVLSGSGTLTYQGHVNSLSAGQCVWIDCRNSYAHRTSDDLWKLRWVHFYGPNLDSIYEKYVERGGSPVFRPANMAPFLQNWESLYQTANTYAHIRDMHINEQLTSLLTLLMAESWHPEAQNKQSSKRQKLQQVKDYLDLHYSEKITLDELAAQFYINKYYLTRVFHENFGVTIISYLTSVRITHAKHLLRFSEQSMEEIARSCGLQNASYLNRVFRKVTGIGPAAYRASWWGHKM